VRVAFNSGAADTGTPFQDANKDQNLGAKLFNYQCKQRGDIFRGNKPNPITVYCVWEC